ncbi:MAG: hypothetical protein ABI690_33605 [Chloroflexota bacterium]
MPNLPHKLLCIFIVLLPFSITIALESSPANCNLRIMFYSNRDDEPGLYSMKPDGSDVEQLITLDEIMPDREFASFSPSPDGTKAAVSLYHTKRESGKETTDAHEIYLVDFDKREAVLLFDDARSALWSPDGKKLAFLSGDYDSHDIYIYDFERMTQSVIDGAILPPESKNLINLRVGHKVGMSTKVSQFE